MSVAIVEDALLERAVQMDKRFHELEVEMSRAASGGDHQHLEQLAREQASLEPVAGRYRQYLENHRELAEARLLLQEAEDADLRELAREEAERLQQAQADILDELAEALKARDPNDERDVILEVRAGTGGEEASLFAADLLRMYLRYAEARGWKAEVLSTSTTGLGGMKEVVVEIAGRGAYSRLKYESGVHRVQRVPVTEASGRIHTSTATVAVLPEPDEVDVEITEDDLRVDVYRSTGHGGQSVNTTDSAVRITHLPTGVVATCQDEKSQLKNRARAMAVLRARLYELERRKAQEAVDHMRRTQVGTGERAEKIRTYNFPQNRVTDHRIGLTLHNLDSILEGQLDPVIDNLAIAAEKEAGR